MSLWAILAALLLAGNDLAAMTPETVSILTNREVIAIDQDGLGKQGDRVYAEGPIEVWAKPLSDGAKAVGIFNRHPQPMTATVNFKEVGFSGSVQVRDVWAAKDLGPMTDSYTVTVPGHGVELLRVKQVSR